MLMHCEGVENISDHYDSGLHKKNSWLLDTAEEDIHKTHIANSDILQNFLNYKN